MPKSDKSSIFTFRMERWLFAAALLGLLLACGGGGAGDALVNLKVVIEPCDSVPSALQTGSCSGTDGTGTYSYKTETASCSEKSGQVIFIDKGGCTPLVANGNNSGPPPAVCKSVLSDPVTAACTGGQLGTHTFQTETASCSANNGKIIVDDTSACLTNTSANRITVALKAGDSRILKAEDAAPLMERAYQSYKLKIQTNNRFLDDFYKSDSETPFAMVKESFFPQPGPTAYDQVFPFVVGDKGNVLASVSTFGGNRIAAYGYDILSGFDLSPTNPIPIADRPRQTAHIPVIKRVLAWLVKGDASVNWSNQAPANLNIAWGSLPTTSTTFTTPSVTNLKKPRAAAGLTALGIPYTNLDCDPLSAAVKDCAAKAQLVVLGASDQYSAVKPLLPTQLQRIQEIMAAKIPILYLSAHPSGGAANDWAGKQFSEDFDRLKAMGFAYGLISQLSNLSNYYPEDSVRSGLSLADMKKRVNPIEGVLTKLNGTTSHLTYTWAAWGVY